VKFSVSPVPGLGGLQDVPGFEIDPFSARPSDWAGRKNDQTELIEGDIQSSKLQIHRFAQKLHLNLPRLMAS